MICLVASPLYFKPPLSQRAGIRSQSVEGLPTSLYLSFRELNTMPILCLVSLSKLCPLQIVFSHLSTLDTAAFSSPLGLTVPFKVLY